MLQRFAQERNDFRVTQTGKSFNGIESSYGDTQPRHSLRHLDAQGTQPDDGDATRQVSLLEKRIGGQDPVAEGFPGFRHHRSATRGKDDAFRSNLTITHLHEVRPQQARAAGNGALS